MKPLMGITSSIDKDEKSKSVDTTNINMILRSGDFPILLLNVLKSEDIEQFANQIDELCVTG